MGSYLHGSKYDCWDKGQTNATPFPIKTVPLRIPIVTYEGSPLLAFSPAEDLAKFLTFITLLLWNGISSWFSLHFFLTMVKSIYIFPYQKPLCYFCDLPISSVDFFFYRNFWKGLLNFSKCFITLFVYVCEWGWGHMPWFQAWRIEGDNPW